MGKGVGVYVGEVGTNEGIGVGKEETVGIADGGMDIVGAAEGSGIGI